MQNEKQLKNNSKMGVPKKEEKQSDVKNTAIIPTVEGWYLSA